MGTIKQVVYESNMSKIEKTNNNVSNSSNTINTISTINNNISEMDLDLLDISPEVLSAGILKSKKGYFGYDDFENEVEVYLKKKNKLDGIENFNCLEYLELENCDLKNSSDLELLPESVDDVCFIYCDIDDYSYLNDKNNLKTIKLEGTDNGVDLSQFQNESVTSFSLVGADGSVEGNLNGMSNLEDIEISYTNINNLDFVRINPKITSLTLEYDLLTDVSPLYDTAIQELNITGNSVNNIDLASFPNLKRLCISGNYNLYTQDLLRYCQDHNIIVDIDQKDVDEINQVRGIINILDLEGKSELEKESIIYNYVIDNMKYNPKTVMESNIDPIKTALTGEGVCVAYSEFFKALCNVAGINAFESTGFGKQNFFNKGPHAWNLVEVEGQYYLCDPTWSDSIRDGSFGYEVKQFINKIFRRGKNPDDGDSFYNVSGKDAKKFMKHHLEWSSVSEDKGKDYIYRDESALNVDNNSGGQSVSIDTSDSDGAEVAIDTVIAGAIPLYSGIKVFSNDVSNRIIDNNS